MLEPLPASQWTRRTADHLLSRAAFLGSPAQREAFFQLGKTSGVAAAVASLVDPVQDWDAYPFPAWTGSEAGIQGQLAGYRYSAEIAQWYVKQLHGAAPLAAKMWKFWVDHFASSSDMVMTDVARAYYPFVHLDILRRGSLGSARTLAGSIYKNGLMMFMLDLHVSVKGAVNQNFGRELLELYTLGVNNGYTEEDVASCAAAFTGHRLDYFNYPYAYFFDSTKADTTAKAFLGTTIFTDQDALDAIFARLDCAKFLCRKIYRYFVTPVPDEALITALAIRLRDVHAYQLRPLLKDIFESAEFYSEANIGRQIKDPADWIVSATKQLETTLLPASAVEQAFYRMSYQVHRPPVVAGWPKPIANGNLWLSSGCLLYRMNLPAALTHTDVSLFGPPANGEGASFPRLDYDALAPAALRAVANFPLLLERLRHRLLPFHRLRPAQVRALYDAFCQAHEIGGELEAVKDLIRLLMALPEYQMQ